MFTVEKSQVGKTQNTYRSPFSKWNDSSWIRTKPIRSAKEISGLPFSPDLVPLANHSAIYSDSHKWTKVLAYRLLAHLQFTTLLELSHVNPVCSLLAQGQAPISMNTEQKHDALKIYCDEGGHASNSHFGNVVQIDTRRNIKTGDFYAALRAKKSK